VARKQKLSSVKQVRVIVQKQQLKGKFGFKQTLWLAVAAAASSFSMKANN